MNLPSFLRPLVPALFLAVLPASAQTLAWLQQFGTAGFDVVSDVAVETDHVYAAGRVGADQALPGEASSGGVDAYVRKIAVADGSVAWTRQFGTAGSEALTRIAPLAGGVAVAGLTTDAFPGQTGAGQADIFLRRFDGAGNTLWTVQFGTAGNDLPLGVATSADAIYVFGLTSGTFAGETSSGGSDFFVGRLDLSGRLLWVRQFGTTLDDPAVFTLGGIAVDGSGVYVGSTVGGALPGAAAIGDADAFVRKFDHAGQVLWTQQFGTACRDLLSSLAVYDGALYVAGSSSGDLAAPQMKRCIHPPIPNENNGGGVSTFVRKLDADGAVAWTRQYGGTNAGPVGFTLAIDLAVGGHGIYVAGEAVRPQSSDPGPSACPSGAPDEDILVQRLDLAGTLGWSRLLGSRSQDTPSAIALVADGVLVGGATRCALADGVNQGSTDAVVARLVNAP